MSIDFHRAVVTAFVQPNPSGNALYMSACMSLGNAAIDIDLVRPIGHWKIGVRRARNGRTRIRYYSNWKSLLSALHREFGLHGHFKLIIQKPEIDCTVLNDRNYFELYVREVMTVCE